MKITPGSRWMSAVCNTEVVVTRAPSAETSLECGGSPMVSIGAARAAGAAPAADHSDGTLLGKRYVDELCTKGGQGSLSIKGKALALRATKPLPSSD
jgi:hypothetical protein